MSSLAEELPGLHYLDPAPDSDRGGEQLFIDDVHLTEEGHLQLMAWLDRELRSRGSEPLIFLVHLHAAVRLRIPEVVPQESQGAVANLGLGHEGVELLRALDRIPVHPGSDSLIESQVALFGA